MPSLGNWIRKDRLIFTLVMMVMVPVVAEWLEKISFIYDYEERNISHRLRSRQPVIHDFQPVYLLQDDDALRQLGAHPWNRQAYGDFLRIVHSWAAPSAVGFDYIFEPNSHVFAREGNPAFAAALQNYPNTVLAAAYGSGFLADGRSADFPLRREGHTDSSNIPPPILPEDLFRQSGATPGLINVFEPALQLVPAYSETEAGTFYAMAIILATKHLGLHIDDIRHDQQFVYLQDSDGIIVRRIPLEQEQLLRINWFRPWEKNHAYSLLHASVHHGVLAGAGADIEDIDRSLEFFDAMNNRVILVGPGDALSKDLSITPMDAFAPRVSVLGNTLETILSERYLYKPGSLPGMLLVTAFVLLIALFLLGTSRHRWRNLSYAGTIAILACYPALAYIAIRWDVVISVIPPIISLTGFSLAATVFQITVIDRKRVKIQKSFQSYLSPVVVRQLIDQDQLPQLGGEEREISALFSDIEGFSSFSEKMSPEALVTFINAYLGELTQCIMKNQGTLDKYIGDAIVAFFGAPSIDPDHANNALIATVALMNAENEINRNWPALHPEWPLPIRTRIGINSGPAIIGNMGSNVRFNYTMLGDSVNLAARCESAAKHYGIRAMVTENTVNKLTKSQKDLLALRPIDRIIVKGKQEPVLIFELLGYRDELSEDDRQCLQIFSKGFEAYQKGDWQSAEEYLSKSALLERQQLNPSKAIIKRLPDLRSNPQYNWNGVYRMSEK
jgi:adenylate cyclase